MSNLRNTYVIGKYMLLIIASTIQTKGRISFLTQSRKDYFNFIKQWLFVDFKIQITFSSSYEQSANYSLNFPKLCFAGVLPWRIRYSATDY